MRGGRILGGSSNEQYSTETVMFRLNRFFTLSLLHKGIKAFETPPLWHHALNSNSALSRKTASHRVSDVIIKQKTVPGFPEDDDVVAAGLSY